MPEFNRRDLLKFFGIGATIVPLIGGEPKIELPAKVIEIPNLEPVAYEHPFMNSSLDEMNTLLMGRERVKVDVTLTHKDGKVHRFGWDTIITSLNVEFTEPALIDVTTHHADPLWRNMIHARFGAPAIKFNMQGLVLTQR